MRAAVAAWSIALGLGLGCEEPPPTPQHRITFRAQSDNAPLAGVLIVTDGRALGRTAEDGRLRVDLTGREGQTVVVQAQCPEAYRPPASVPVLVLRSFHTNDPVVRERGIEFAIDCPPAERIAAVVIRAAGQADLPVKLRGQEIARTDRSGVAHLLLRLAPNSTFRVQLDTEGRELQPQNPGATFTVPDADQIFLYDQPFETKARRVRIRRRPPPPPAVRIPMRID
jgi:hypothetical protein